MSWGGPDESQRPAAPSPPSIVPGVAATEGGEVGVGAGRARSWFSV